MLVISVSENRSMGYIDENNYQKENIVSWGSKLSDQMTGMTQYPKTSIFNVKDLTFIMTTADIFVVSLIKNGEHAAVQ